jgi:hypothetical protein
MFQYHSSDVTWCESKYAVSRYIVEFMNTISNLPVLFLALHSFRHRFTMLNLIFVSIPIFSFYFHATLSHAGQCLDELAILLFVILLEDNLPLRLLETCISLICLVVLPVANRYLLVCYVLVKSYKYYHYDHIDQKLCKRILFLLGSGFILWTIDIIFCDYLVISLHWVWHLFSGLALYYAIELLANNKVVKE